MDPAQAWASPDVVDQLLADPSTRPFMADPGFRATVDKITRFPACLPSKMHDPRVVAAQMVLSGLEQRVKVSSEDLSKAERVGDIPKRAAVQLPDMEKAMCHSTASEAKEAGNQYFKQGEYNAALACYDRSVQLAAITNGNSPDFTISCLSNAAMCLIRLKRWEEAEERCEGALVHQEKHSGRLDFDSSKLWFRLSVAREHQGRLEEAYQDMRHAQDLYGRKLMEEESGYTTKQLLELHKEANRLEAAVAAGGVRKAREKTHAREEQDAKGLREGGQPLQPRPSVSGGIEKAPSKPAPADSSDKTSVASAQGISSEGVRKEAQEKDGWAVAPKHTAGYLEDLDLTFFLRSRLTEVFVNKKFRVEGWAHVLITEMVSCEAHANVATKNDARSLFYSIDVTFGWAAVKSIDTSTEGAEEEQDSNIRGIIRLYNIAQETKFSPGGGDETSYMFQLGYAKGLSEDHLDTLNATGDELFYRLAGAMAAVIRQVRAKSEGHYSTTKIDMVESSATVQAAAAASLAASSNMNNRTCDENCSDNKSIPTMDIGADALRKAPKPGLKGFLNQKTKSEGTKHPKQSLSQWAEARKLKGFKGGFLK